MEQWPYNCPLGTPWVLLNWPWNYRNTTKTAVIQLISSQIWSAFIRIIGFSLGLMVHLIALVVFLQLSHFQDTLIYILLLRRTRKWSNTSCNVPFISFNDFWDALTGNTNGGIVRQCLCFLKPGNIKCLLNILLRNITGTILRINLSNFCIFCSPLLSPPLHFTMLC